MSQEQPKVVEEKKEYKYAVFQETSGEECETWLYFIRYQGNEEALAHLNKQLDQVEWYIVDDLSTFDLEMDYLVCERTAKEMSKVDLNHYSFHRKFDGKLKRIDLGFKEHHSNEKKMVKAFDVLGYGKIEEYVSDEDIDPEDMINIRSDSESGSDEEETGSESESSNSQEEKKKKKGRMPDASRKVDIPRFAKAKASKAKMKKQEKRDK